MHRLPSRSPIARQRLDDEDEDEDSSDSNSSDTTTTTTTTSLSSSISRSSSSLSLNRHPSYSRSSSSSSMVPRSRKAIKISLTVSQTRRAITNHAWTELWQSLLTLDVILNGSHTELGIFLPILARIATDLELLLAEHENDREYRKRLSSSEAKSLSILVQKWPKMATEVGWRSVRESVENVPKPASIGDGAVDRPTAQLLATLESILVLGSPRKLSLARLGLECVPQALVELDEVVRWYVSFEGSLLTSRRVKSVLGSIKLLDLSRNQLTALPDSLPRILPLLETLNLGHNSFVALPTTITQFRHLDRLGVKESTRRRKGNLRATWDAITASGSGSRPQERDRLPSLAVLCIRIIQRSLRSPSASVAGAERAQPRGGLGGGLAPHLRRAVEVGYDCESCGKFVGPPPDGLAPIYERVRLLSPAVSLPQATDDARGRLRTGPLAILNVLGAAAVSPHRLTIAERVAVAVGCRGSERVAVVIGPRRLCGRCGWLHLSFERSVVSEPEPELDLGECRCVGCVEERLAVGEVGLVRWVRKKVPRN
ncbi:hypothetical protein CROQUDRAFT_659178 [Cronartium quercuum f. sp. fusiforme G11]|uniref:Uncharacterized protein n=1 Tax=Cronartium quercuum f. sp. fusiforme G11 TaxID=708437 RepID=A0A9P6TAE1_9BASI|nr:hypothetical protein CROQUDRAFT_659178 [Cronartium quercuum f. sp. fusiforme G11]